MHPPDENNRRLLERESNLVNLMAIVAIDLGSVAGPSYGIQWLQRLSLNVQVKCHDTNILISFSVTPSDIDLPSDTSKTI